MNDFAKSKLKCMTNRKSNHEMQSTSQVLSPVSQNSDCEKSKIKKRKKRKSVIYKPYKSPKKLKCIQSPKKIKCMEPPKLSIELDSTDQSFISSRISLKPSTTEVSDEAEFHREDRDHLSEDSVSLNNRRLHHPKSDSSFNIGCQHSYTSSDSDMREVFNEFFEHSTVQKDTSYIGDISELMCDVHFEKDNENDGLSCEDTDSDKEQCSDDMNDSFDLRINDLLDNNEVSGDTDSENSEPDFELFEIKSEYVVVLKYSQTIELFGYCNLKVLFGKINILGYTLTSKSPEHAIFSPRGTALLTLKNKSAFCDELVKLKNLVPQLQNEPSVKQLIIRKDSSVIKFSKKNDFILSFIEQHVSQRILPRKSIYPCLEVEQKSTRNSITNSEEWDKVIGSVTSNCKLFICGGKGVGKSTFLRYTINCLIQKYEKIRVIDLDPGQSEFTVPGTLSIVTVTEPLLGVNYAHLKETDRSILCDINVSQDPLKYVQRIQELVKCSKNKEYQNIPTLINYMGYTNDIAFHLVSSAIVILQPSKIVYIHSANVKKNYKIPLNKKNILTHSKLFCPNSTSDFKIKVIRIPSVTDNNTGWTLEPRQMREMCILAYFGKTMNESAKSLQDFSLEMFEVNLQEISVTDKENLKVSTDAINGNIVALCILVNEDPCMFQCFGWSIVRCINTANNKATIITPVQEVILDKVTHFVVGCLTLPPSVYMNTEYVHDEIPYIMQGELLDYGQMSKRTHIPSNTSKK